MLVISRSLSVLIGACFVFLLKRGKLMDTILDWEDSLPDRDLNWASDASRCVPLYRIARSSPLPNLWILNFRWIGSFGICSASGLGKLLWWKPRRRPTGFLKQVEMLLIEENISSSGGNGGGSGWFPGRRFMAQLGHIISAAKKR